MKTKINFMFEFFRMCISVFLFFIWVEPNISINIDKSIIIVGYGKFKNKFYYSFPKWLTYKMFETSLWNKYIK